MYYHEDERSILLETSIPHPVLIPRTHNSHKRVLYIVDPQVYFMVFLEAPHICRGNYDHLVPFGCDEECYDYKGQTQGLFGGGGSI